MSSIFFANSTSMGFPIKQAPAKKLVANTLFFNICVELYTQYYLKILMKRRKQMYLLAEQEKYWAFENCVWDQMAKSLREKKRLIEIR